jgi:putative ABC transport system permease protein
LSWTAATLDEPLRAIDPGLRFQWRIEPVLFAATGAAALLAIIVAGLVPAIRLTSSSVSRALAVDGASSTPRWRGRGNLIAIQSGVSVALFLIAVVCVRFLTDPATSRRVGVISGVERLVIGLMPFGEQGVHEAEARLILGRVADALRSSRLVETVSVVSGLSETRFNLHVRSSGPTGWIRRADDPWLPGEIGGGGMVNLVAATPNAFETAGLALASGRLFDERDRAGQDPVVVLSRVLASALFDSAPAVGQRVLVQLQENPLSRDFVVKDATVVGVVARPDVSVEVDRARAVWLPYEQQYLPTMGFLVRASHADARPVVGLVADAFREVSPDLALQAVGRVDVIVNGPLVFLRHIAAVVSLLGGLALVLTMSGLYGVLSQVVSKRRREMGLRIALGADRGRILRLVLLGGFRPVAEGLVIGFGVAWVFRQLMQLEFTATLAAMDLAMFLLAALPLIAAAAVACYLPARRAARVDPNIALRDL